MLGDQIGGDLKRTGATLGATSQPQQFTNGIKIDALEGISGNCITLNDDLDTDRWLSSLTNTFLGHGVAGAGNLSHVTGNEGYRNTAVGNQALYSITDGELNTAVGYRALYSLTTGLRNLAQGQTALENLTSGSDNQAQGNAALRDCTSGQHNCGFGGQVLTNLTTGDDNIAMGHQTLFNVLAGNNNAALGHQAGYANNVSGCVYLGYQAGYNNSADNCLFIENSNSATPLIYGDFANDFVIINDELRIAGDVGGQAAHNSFTGATDTPTSDPGWSNSSTVDMTPPNGYLKAYVGTQPVTIPYWHT